jgi:hypothetical protein
MIPASAVVDVIEPPPAHGQGLGRYRVEAWGKAPNDYVRVYEISAVDANMAAVEGLQRFSDEITILIESKDS